MRAILRYLNVEKREREIKATEPDKKRFDRILKYTGVFGSVHGFSMLVKLLNNMFKSRLLGPMGFGIIENLNRNTDLIRNSTNLGLMTVAVPEISKCESNPEPGCLEHKILLTRSWAMLTAIVGTVLCLVLAPVLSRRAFDGSADYTVSFMILSISVAAAAVTNGEIAILKATGRLRQLALSMFLAELLSLCISVPLYWFLGYDGIVIALAMSVLNSMVVTCCYSFRYFAYRVRPFSWSLLRQGTGMIEMGLFLTFAAFAGAWAWSFVAKFLMEQGGEELVGIYSAGYHALVASFTSIVLSGMDSEFFPSLSAAGNDMGRAHSLMNNQSLALCMIAAPAVILFMVCVPAVVYVVLGYEKFTDTILLSQMAVAGVYFKAVGMPVAYCVLVKSDSLIYVIQEVMDNILLIVCVVLGYRLGGINGVGLALAVWEVFYLILVLLISKLRYGYRMDSALVRNFLMQGAFVVAATYGIINGGVMGYGLSIAMCICASSVTLHFFKEHTTFVPGVLSKVFRKYHKH